MTELKKQVLYTAGLSFCNDTHIGYFYDAFLELCETKSEGINNWLRAFRNIVQFRQNGLSDQVVETDALDTILDTIIHNYAGQIYQNNYEATLNNCLRSVLFILKRRRYDPDFLDSDDPRTKEIEGLLKVTAENHHIDKYKHYAESTLKFLYKQARLKDIPGFE